MSSVFPGSREAVLMRNNVRISGRGERTVVFAHGFGCDQNMWRFVAPSFEADHRVVLFDYVGSGKSDLAAFNPAKYARLDGYAQDVLDVCRALDLREAVFVGHSVSSMVGLLAAIEEPRCFSQLVMIGPSPRYINEPPGYVGGFEREDIEGLMSVMEHNYVGWAQQIAPVIMGNSERPELTRELEQSFCSTDPKAATVFARATFLADNRADLPKAPVPSFILQVSDDAIAPVSVGRYVHAALPRSVLSILEASGHCPHMSHPSQTVAAIREYLSSHGPS